MNFLAIDVETANPDMASICQIGFVIYNDGKLVEEWKTFLDPEDYFDINNVSIHGISESDVRKSPKFPDVYKFLKEKLEKYICICHTHFDWVSLNQVCNKYELSTIENKWLDTAKVSRRCWSEFAQKGYGLKNVCNKLGFTFKHHDALEDAKASAFILLTAMKEKNYTIDEWMLSVNRPITKPKSYSYENIKGNPDGDLYGEVMVFTGKLQIERKNAQRMAADIGCDVIKNVTKETTILVVGDRDIKFDNPKSNKHQKAEKYISNGLNIKILQESDFLALFELIEKTP